MGTTLAVGLGVLNTLVGFGAVVVAGEFHCGEDAVLIFRPNCGSLCYYKMSYVEDIQQCMGSDPSRKDMTSIEKVLIIFLLVSGLLTLWAVDFLSTEEKTNDFV